MDAYILNGINIALFLDNRREIKTGNYPVKIRITYKLERKYYSTGKSLCVQDWDKLEKTKNTDLLNIKKDLQISFEKVRDAVQTLESEGNFSFDALNIYLGKCTGDTLNMAFKAKIDGLIESGSIGNSDVYTCAYKYFDWYRRLGRRDISIFGKWKRDFIWEQTQLNFIDAFRAMKIVMNIYQH